MKKRIFVLSLALMLLLSLQLASCGAKEKENDGNFWIYYLNMDETCIDRERGTVETEGKSVQEIAEALLECMASEPQTTGLRRAVWSTDDDYTYMYRSVAVGNYEAVVDFSSAFAKADSRINLLVRCAIVETLCQIDDISYVRFTINGEPMEIDGNRVEKMSPEDIVLNPDEDINNSEEDSIILYLANEDGTGLVKVNTPVSYNTGTPKEKVVMKELIRGTTEEGVKSTIPSETRIIAVSVMDGVCYVNLDDTFLNSQDDTIRENVILYSIVDSLTELDGIDKVQIAVNGDSNLTLRYDCDLSVPYSADYGLVVGEDNSADTD